MPIINKNERKRYREKIGRLQYNRDLRFDKNSETVNFIKAQDTQDVESINNNILAFQDRTDLICMRLDELEKDVIKLERVLATQNKSESGLVPYGEVVGIDEGKTLVEKKGLFGKSKWVEEEIK